MNLSDILPELTGEGEDTGWVSVPLEMKPPWVVEEVRRPTATLLGHPHRNPARSP